MPPCQNLWAAWRPGSVPPPPPHGFFVNHGVGPLEGGQDLGWNWPEEHRALFLGNLPLNAIEFPAMVEQVILRIPRLALVEVRMGHKVSAAGHSSAIVIVGNPAYNVLAMIQELHGHLSGPEIRACSLFIHGHEHTRM